MRFPGFVLLTGAVVSVAGVSASPAADHSESLLPAMIGADRQPPSGIRQVTYAGIADDLPESLPGRRQTDGLPDCDFDWESLCETYTDVNGRRRRLPLLANLAVERGYELPLPFGVQEVYTWIRPDAVVDEVRVGFGGAPPTTVVPISVDKPEIETHSLITRIDGWILPFLNVYGLVGYSSVDTSVALTVPNPLPGPDVRIPINTTFSGPTWGSGATLVVGYRNVFAMVDSNYTYVDLDSFDSKISKGTVGIRSGLQGTWQNCKGAVWVGGMYIDGRTTLEGSLNTGIGALDPVRFEVDQDSDQPWNFLMGFNWEPSSHLMLTVEGGVGARQQITVAGTWRF